MTQASAYEYFTSRVKGRKKCLYYMGASFSGDKTVEIIDATAAFFRDQGVEKGDVVAINLPNTPECIFAIYALNKLGAVAFVTHPLLPAEALKEAILQTRAKLLVCLDTLTDEMPVPKVLCDAVSYLPTFKRLLARLFKKRGKAKGIAFPYGATGGAEIAPQGGEEDVALYLPSGGTTGEPKTICVTNRAFNENATATFSLAKIPVEGEGVLLALPFFHGFGLSSCLHGGVAGGAEGVILPYLDYKLAAKYVKKGKVRFILAVPNIFKKLLAEKDFRKGIGNMLLAFCGGDTLPIAVKKEYDELAQAAGSPGRLYQGYGLAETVSVCVANCLGADKAGTIGKPVCSEVVILNEDGEELPTGQIGEICVSAPFMMKGYLGQPDFSDKYLRTGDLGSYDEDGFLRFAGRKKRIIVIGGMNVYPLEIEKVAEELSFVQEAAAEEYLEDGKPKIALFVKKEDALSEKEAREAILAHLRSRIIRYALPSKVISVDSFPRTPIGKIDHKSLSKKI